MALMLADRVKQTGTANTTVSFTLSATVAGFRSFSTIGNGNTTYYTATDNAGNWESGLGTYTSASTLLTRNTILASSNSGSAVTFSGTVTVFVTYPAGKAIYADANGDVTVPGNVLTANTPAFRVYGAGTTNNLTTTQNTNGVLNSNNFAVDFNQGSYLNTTTGVFTAPVAGLYQVNMVGRNSGYILGISQLSVLKNSTVVIMVEWAASSTMNHAGGSSVVKLAVNDTLTLKVLAGQINFDSNDNWSVAFLG